jgi:hypothetical protein
LAWQPQWIGAKEEDKDEEDDGANRQTLMELDAVTNERVEEARAHEPKTLTTVATEAMVIVVLNM